MDKVLSIISDYVTTCTSCHFGKVGNCEYINPQTPSSTENAPIDMEEYRKLTHQQKAFRGEGNRVPPCDMQITFAELIDKVEEALYDVSIEFDAPTLLRYLTKINNIDKSLWRHSLYVSLAYDNIVMTCLERCIAHIDYQFLEEKIDVEEAILSVFPDYNRIDALCIAHPKAFVNTYLSQATKISLERMVSQPIDLRVVRNEIEEAANLENEIFNPDGTFVVTPPPPQTLEKNEDESELYDEDFSLDYVKCSGVKEIDRIFKLLVEDLPIYPDEVFYADIKSFRKKCEEIAHNEADLDKKEAWVVSVINVLAESYFQFSIDNNEQICDRLMSFWGVIEATFMSAPKPFCVKRIAMELSIDDLLTIPTPESLEAHQKPDADPRLNPLTLVERAIFEELGPTIGYCERKICKSCDLTDCPFRWGNKRMYYEEIEGEEEENIASEVRTKAERSKKKLSDDRVATLVKHLAKLGYCVLGEDFKYVWQKDQDTYAYFCYKLSDEFVGKDVQLETNYIFKNIMCSRFHLDTIGRYARQYRKNEKRRPELADQIDNIIQEGLLRHL